MSPGTKLMSMLIVTAALIGQALEPGVVVRPDIAVGHQIGRAGLEPEGLGILVWDD